VTAAIVRVESATDGGPPGSTTVEGVEAASETAAPADSDSIESIAGAWLAAEEALARGSGNPEQSEITARDLSARYDEAIRTASREDLRLAWEAARKLQGETEMGSEAWASARRLSELLHSEYLALEAEPAAG
jgi:hypothetical protein